MLLSNTPLPPLLLDVFARITGQGSDDLDALRRQKRRGVFLALFDQDSEIAAVDNLMGARSGFPHQIPENGIELRRAPSDIDRVQLPISGRIHQLDDAFRSFPRHLFAAMGAGFHVTVSTGLVAQFSDVDLQRSQRASVHRTPAFRQPFGEGGPGASEAILVRLWPCWIDRK